MWRCPEFVKKIQLKCWAQTIGAFFVEIALVIFLDGFYQELTAGLPLLLFTSVLGVYLLGLYRNRKILFAEENFGTDWCAFLQLQIIWIVISIVILLLVSSIILATQGIGY